MIFANQVTLCGKVVKEPIFSKTNSGKSVCKIIMVVERNVGGIMKRSDYIPIALWAKKADVAKELICRGDELMIVGSVAQERWETVDHDKRSRIGIQVDKGWVIPPPDEEDDYIDGEDDKISDDHNIVDKMEVMVGDADSSY